MKITPRAPEVAAMEAVLTQEYPDAKAAARASLKAAGEILGLRSTVVVLAASAHSAWPVAFGPFASDSEATKFAEKLQDKADKVALYPLAPATLDSPDPCAECGHSPGEHQMSGERNSRGGCLACRQCIKYVKGSTALTFNMEGDAQ